MRLSQRILIKKLQKWENYLAFVENMDTSAFAELSEGSDAELSETTKENLFAHIPIYDELLKKYNLHVIAGNGDTFCKVRNVMQWLTDKTFYSGASAKWNADNSLDILEYAYEKPFSNAICCREKAIVLTDCLLALGIYAYPICMLAANNGGCHFTTHVYLPERRKWVLFDPSFNCWFTKDGEPQSVWELKSAYLNGENPILENYSFNHTDKCRTVYIEGFIKQNLTGLSTWHDNSMDKRGYKKNDWASKKDFKTKLPNAEI